MREVAKILLCMTPKYGEILLGVGNIALLHKKSILNNVLARREIKQYLETEAPKKIDMAGVSKSKDFKKIIFNYTQQKHAEYAHKEDYSSKKRMTVLLIEFFRRCVWPVLVSEYIDNICYDVDSVVIDVNINKNVYIKIYDECNPEFFLNEFKEFLEYNHIIISESSIKEDGNIFVKLKVPVVRNTKTEF